MARESAQETEVIPELPGYRIMRRLGRGSMGVVYLAEDLHLRRQVAVKVLAPTMIDSELFRARFNRESRHAATLDHPNIIPVYAAGDAAGAQYIAMRYAAGGDLRALLETTGPLSLKQASAVIAAVADALDAAHAQGIIHRDVKPANILIDSRNGQHHYYLSDFGIAKISSTGRSLTSTGQILGTIDYLAPEQVQGKPVDSRADLYALGCVLYYCLTGAVPFPRADIAALMWAHVHETPPPVTARRPDLPPQIDHIVAKALAKQPADRYPTGRELAAALHAPAAEIPSSTPSLVSAGTTGTYTALAPTPARTPTTTAPRRHTWWWIAACSVLAPILIAGSTIVVRNYLNSRYPTKAEKELLKQLPRASWVDSCQRSPDPGKDPANVQASVTCTPNGNQLTVTFTKFTSLQALDGRYHDDMTNDRTDQGQGDCRNAESAEGPYASNPKRRTRTSGRVFCYQDSGRSFIEWTEKNFQILGRATQDGSDYQKLRDWWGDLVNIKPLTLRTPKPPAHEPTPSIPSGQPPSAPIPHHPAREADAAGPAAPVEETRRQPPGQPANTPAGTPGPNIPVAPANPPDTTLYAPDSPVTPSAPPTSREVTLASPTPDKPKSPHNGPAQPGKGGCQIYETPDYLCTITRTAPLYLAGTTEIYDEVDPMTARFLCQSQGTEYPGENLATHWWAWVWIDDAHGAWIPVTFLTGAHGDAPVPGLPRCASSSTTTTTTPPTTTTNSQPAGN